MRTSFPHVFGRGGGERGFLLLTLFFSAPPPHSTSIGRCWEPFDPWRRRRRREGSFPPFPPRGMGWGGVWKKKRTWLQAGRGGDLSKSKGGGGLFLRYNCDFVLSPYSGCVESGKNSRSTSRACWEKKTSLSLSLAPRQTCRDAFLFHHTRMKRKKNFFSLSRNDSSPVFPSSSNSFKPTFFWYPRVKHV